MQAVPLPDGDRPVDLWVDGAGCLVAEPVHGAERLPGRYVAPGLVDAHAHPAVGWEAGAPVALDQAETLKALAGWARSGVCHAGNEEATQTRWVFVARSIGVACATTPVPVSSLPPTGTVTVRGSLTIGHFTIPFSFPYRR